MSDIRLPTPPRDEYLERLNLNLTNTLRDLQTRIDLIAGGYLSGARNTATSVPTTGAYAVGDFVKKSNPVEAGSGGSKYVLAGWMCVTAGTPGTWLECRFLTGN